MLSSCSMPDPLAVSTNLSWSSSGVVANPLVESRQTAIPSACDTSFGSPDERAFRSCREQVDVLTICGLRFDHDVVTAVERHGPEFKAICRPGTGNRRKITLNEFSRQLVVAVSGTKVERQGSLAGNAYVFADAEKDLDLQTGRVFGAGGCYKERKHDAS